MFLRRLFINNWFQKATSLFLAISLWLMINESLTTTRTLDNVAVKIINIPPGMTVDGLLPNNILSKKIALSLQGNKNILKDLTANDLEIVLDATDKSGEWIASISRKNLISLNPDIELSKAVKQVVAQKLPISFVRLVTEKIPIMVTHPIGEAPRDFQFLDVWPYCLSITVSGPEEKIKELKAKGINLTLNLNDIDRHSLEESDSNSDEISFKVPDDWKYVELPSLSDRHLLIDDPRAQELRIDFVKSNLHPIAKPIPISLFFSAKHSRTANPDTYSLALGNLVDEFRGLRIISTPLFAKGASRLFVELVQEMLQISVIVNPKEQKLGWCVQFQNPRMLEDKYVSLLLSDEELRNKDPSFAKQREEYLRNRFRNYMNCFELYKSETEKLKLAIKVKDQQIHIKDSTQ